MHREILFKAMRKNWENFPTIKKWIEGYYFKMGDTARCCKDDRENNPVKCKHFICYSVMTDWSFPNEPIFIEIDPNTVCQYTGLTDKNGNKIWENDIMHKAYHPEEDCIIQWHDGSYRFKMIHGSYRRDPMTFSNECVTEKTVRNLKVIGNVFDNRELLE